MDINNLEELTTLYNFTFNITGDCPWEILGEEYNESCGGDCVYCWRNALRERIDSLE